MILFEKVLRKKVNSFTLTVNCFIFYTSISFAYGQLNEPVSAINDSVPLNTQYVDLRDGQTYNTVKIGSQIWMTENLAYRPDSGKYWAYMNDERFVREYGYLYSWETAQNVCPSGWHLPSKSDFNALFAISGMGKEGYFNLVRNGTLGFGIISSGLGQNNNFTPIGGGTAFWTSTANEKKRKLAWGVGVGMEVRTIRLNYNYTKKSGLQVRCLKD